MATSESPVVSPASADDDWTLVEAVAEQWDVVSILPSDDDGEEVAAITGKHGEPLLQPLAVGEPELQPHLALLRSSSKEEGQALLRSLPADTRRALAHKVAIAAQRKPQAKLQEALQADNADKRRAERERIERERTALATECAGRWPDLLLRVDSSSPGNAPLATAESSAGDVSEEDLLQVKLDIDRTRGADPAFRASDMPARLEALMVGFCRRERVPYTQGLNEIAATFAFVQASAGSEFGDETALACFAAFVRRFVPFFYDGESFVALHVSLLFFRQLVLYHHPDLHNFLTEAEVSPLTYAVPWFLTLFATKTPMSVLLQFWDAYCARGDAGFLLFFAVAMLATEKSAIFLEPSDDVHTALLRIGLRSSERLRVVWAAAEELQAKTPQSFGLRLSRSLSAVGEACRAQDKSEESPERVLERIERERRFMMLPGEVALHCARRPGISTSRTDGAGPSISGGASIGDESNGRVATTGSSPTGEQGHSDRQPSARGHGRSSSRRALRLFLFDLRSPREFEAGHLPGALHFHPPCLRRAVAAAHSSGRRDLNRLAAMLSASVRSARGGPPGGASQNTGMGDRSSWAEPALVDEFLVSLQDAAGAHWGDQWLCESTGAHIVLMGAAAEVALLYEVLTERYALLRVGVALGGTEAVHREAAKRGVALQQGMPTYLAGAPAMEWFGSAWSRLQESAPGAGARVQHLLRKGAEAASAGSEVARVRAGEVAETVRQQAPELAAAARQQIASASAAVQHGIKNLDLAGEDFAGASWPCELLPSNATASAAEPARRAVVRLSAGGSLRFVAGGAGDSASVAGPFNVELLKRIGLSPSSPDILTFSFHAASAAVSSINGRPHVVARFESAEAAKSCARAVAGMAASAKRQRAARAESLAESASPHRKPAEAFVKPQDSGASASGFEGPTLIPGNVERTMLTDAMAALITDYLPMIFRVSGNVEWVLAYTPKAHGVSLQTFYRTLEPHETTVLLVRDASSHVFGGFCTQPWAPGGLRGFFGSGEAFVFSFGKVNGPSACAATEGSLQLRCHTWCGETTNQCFQYADNEYFAMGGGADSSSGGSGRHALAIKDDFLHGFSFKSRTFHSPPLASQEEFVVDDIEVWVLQEKSAPRLEHLDRSSQEPHTAPLSPIAQVALEAIESAADGRAADAAGVPASDVATAGLTNLVPQLEVSGDGDKVQDVVTSVGNNSSDDPFFRELDELAGLDS